MLLVLYYMKSQGYTTFQQQTVMSLVLYLDISVAKN